ncbi:MAG: hypothetical protein Q4D08_04280 [Clostridia bacterium]|nr:hypothetical protein [Clostridia bacterium]
MKSTYTFPNRSLLRRLLSTFLSLAMVLSLLPVWGLTALADNGIPAYHRESPEVAVLNAYSGSSEKLYSAIKGDGAYAAYNGIGLYKRQNDGAQAKYSDRATGNELAWDFNLDETAPVLKKLAKVSNNLQFNTSATFYNRTHTHSHYSWKEVKTYTAEMTVTEKVYATFGGSARVIDGWSDKSRTYPRIGDLGGVQSNNSDGFNTIYYKNDYCSLQFSHRTFAWKDFEYRTCTCGGSYAENFVVAFRDTRAPQLVDVQYKIDNGSYASFNKGASLGLGRTLSIKLCFDEPIRFADDSAVGKGDLYLDLQADGQSAGKYHAQLVELSGSDLIFEYTVPNDQETDVRIVALGMDALFRPNATLPLKQVNKDSSFSIAGDIKVNGSTLGLSTTTCYITDLAGNAPQKQTILDANLTLDSGAPYVAKVAFELTCNNADVKEALGKTDKGPGTANYDENSYTDNSDLYLGVGDSFYLIVHMNERLKGVERQSSGSLTWENAVFTTSLLDADNKPVTVNSWYFYPYNESQTEATQFITHSVTIQPGYHLAEGYEQIKVIKMAFADGNGITLGEITDRAGNPLNKNDVTISPTANANPPKLDTDAPMAAEIADSYAQEGNGFRYGVSLSDAASGYAGIYGSFILNNNGDGKAYQYEWAVKADTAQVAEDEWQEGTTGTARQLLQTQNIYFYIRPKAGETYVDLSGCTLTIKAKDYAGNESNITLPVGGLAWYIDNLAPTAVAGSTTRVLNSGGTGGTLTAEVILTDGRGISAWQYAWSDSGDSAPTNWSDGHVTATSTDGATVYASAQVGDGVLFSQYLWVKATDNSVNKNESAPICLGQYSYDLRDADYALEYPRSFTEYANLKVAEQGNDDTLFFLVPAAEDSEYYAVYQMVSNGDYNIFGQPIAVDASTSNGWKFYRITLDDDGNYTLTPDPDRRAASLLKTLQPGASSFYSGNLSVTVLAGKTSAYTQAANGVITLGNPSNKFGEDTVALRLTGYANDLFGKISLTCNDDLGNVHYNSGWSTAKGYQRTTLAGLRFTVSIAGDHRGWRYENVDWQQSCIRLENKSTNKGYNIPIGPFQIPESDPNGAVSQTVTVPEDSYESGVYIATFHLALKAGRDDYGAWLPNGSTYREIAVDTVQPNSDFSLSSVIYDPQAKYDYLRTAYGLNQSYGEGGKLELASDSGIIYLPISKSQVDPTYARIATAPKHYVTVTSPTEAGWKDIGTNSSATAFVGCYAVQLWNTAHADNKVELTTADDPTSVTTDGSLSFVFRADEQDSTHLYLTPGQINTVAVQKVYDNGRRSDIKYYQIMPVEEAIGGSIRLDKDAKQLVFTPEAGASTAGATVFAWAWQNDQDELKGEGQRIEMNAYADGTWRCALQENGANYAVITVSAHGALCEVGSLGQRAPWFDDGPGAYNKDNGISGLEFKDNSNGTYTLKFRVRDDQDTMKDGLTVDIGFNKEYSQNTFTLTYDGTDVTWTTNDGHPTGIYSVTAVKKIYPTTSRLTSRDYLDVTVEGVFAKVPDGTPMDITVTATDAFGNAGSVSSTGHPVNYVEPKVIERKTLLGMTFNQPVRPVESWAWHEKDGDGFKTSWTGAFPISGNGIWSIQYRDAFGQIHAEEITVDDFTENGKDYSLALAFSTTELTAEAVTMTTNAANGTVKVYEVNGTSHTEMRPVDGFPGVGTQKRQTPINENMETQAEVMDGGSVIYRLRVYIDNIVSGAPEADVRYYVEQLGQEFTQSELDAYAASGVTVTGNIRAWYNTARHVTPTGDTGSAFLFTPGGAASHTFTYEDDLGNAGSVTATLPAGLMLQAPTQPPEDTTAPTVDVDIYVKRAGSYTRAEAFLATDNQADIDSKFGNLGYVQGYNLAVNAVDASGFTIAVTGDGAALNGNTVTITKAGTYTVTVTDKSPRANKTEFTFTVPDRIDTTPPTATVAVSAKSLYEKTITLTLEDKGNNGNLISIQDENGIELDTVTLNAPADATRTRRNTYVYDVADNGNIQFLFRDIAGNTGSTTKTISGIDTAPPELTVRWSPSDEKDAAFPPAGPISSNITAHIDSNKAMQNLTVRAENETDGHPLLTDGTATSHTIYGQDNRDLVTITATPERVTVTFKENYNQTLIFTASSANGKSTVVTINGTTAIDKVAPEVDRMVVTRYDRKGTTVGATNAAYQVVVAITPSKPVTSANYGGTKVYRGQLMPVIYDQDHPLEITFTRDGTYTVLLNDQAGNTTTVPVTIAGIDRAAPELTVTTVEANNRVKATVTVNEPCTVTWGENGRHIFGAAGSHEITFTQNGTFAITAVDAAGNESFKMVTVGSIDNDPPSISFDNGTIYVTEGTTEGALKAALDKGYTVWDNVTAANELTVTYDSSTVVLTAAGQYAVTYTVLDKARNQATASRFVRVIGADTVCVSIDGQLILPDSTAVLRPGEHTLTLQNSAQPYSIKARRGILSAGQMKYLSGSSLHFDADGKFTVSSTGYYTLLVTTQDRQTIRVLLYVEQ